MELKTYSPIESLPTGKSIRFNTPLTEDTGDALFRTGVIGDGSCLVKGTQVWTMNGLKNIEDVRLGDEVVTHTGEVKPVIQLHTNRLKHRKIHSLSIYMTPQIQITNNHRLMALKEGETQATWIAVENLTNEHYVQIPYKKGGLSTYSIDLCDQEWTFNPTFCFFLGFWFGCGFFHREGIGLRYAPDYVLRTAINTLKIEPIPTDRGLLFKDILIRNIFSALFENGRLIFPILNKLNSDCIESFLFGLNNRKPCEEIYYLARSIGWVDHSENMLKVNSNIYLKVVENQVTDLHPEYVYTLGIKDVHSYSVEGVIVENCLFHAIYETTSAEYREKDNSGKKAFVAEKRGELASELTENMWKSISGGEVALLSFQDIFRNLIRGFYMFVINASRNVMVRTRIQGLKYVIEKVVLENAFDIYKSITEIIPYDQLDTELLDKGLNCGGLVHHGDNSLVDQCLEQVLLMANDFFAEKLGDKAEQASYLFYQIGITAENTAYLNYIQELKACEKWIGQTQLELISNNIDRNIFFIDGATRMPYVVAGCSNFKADRKSIIIVWVDEVHYEPIGKLVNVRRKSSGKTHANAEREFDWDDDLIQKLYLLSCRLDEAKDVYPLLYYQMIEAKREIEQRVEKMEPEAEEEEEESKEWGFWGGDDEDEDESDNDFPF